MNYTNYHELVLLYLRSSALICGLLLSVAVLLAADLRRFALIFYYHIIGGTRAEQWFFCLAPKVCPSAGR